MYQLPKKENKVHAKNEPRRMQNEGSGAKTRSQVPRKLTVKHRKWRATTKVVSRAIVSLKREETRCVPKIGANGGS